MHAVDVLASAAHRPHCEGVRMKQPTAGKTLSDELPRRGLQKTSTYHRTKGAVREPQPQSAPPAFTLIF